MQSINNIKICEKKDFIIEGIMKSKGLYCLIAFPKVGKSMLALQIADAVANNKLFLGHNVISSPVLYVSTENSASQIKDREKLMNLCFGDNKLFIIVRNEMHQKFSLRDMEYEIKKFSEDYNGRLIILDMLKDIEFDFGYDINSYQDVGQKVLPKLREIAEQYNVTILFIHHLNKNGKSLGSTVFDGSVDGVLRLFQNKINKRNYKLIIENRDYESIEQPLIKDDNCILHLCSDDDEEELSDINLILLVKYISSNNNCEFTCTEIVNKLNLLITPKKLGKLINNNLDLLAKEGVRIEKRRTGVARTYLASYNEVVIEDD